ncbi:MAG: hypothetical protein CMQ54_01825 [Gammaproteobacteria bacterium]|nr:hypothetical protein [Gammaproteobacteria bacterium]|tara:strand:+ start:3382 stop:3900 length:519 start_codon:yes stop_codon:yes gene_type:complete
MLRSFFKKLALKNHHFMEEWYMLSFRHLLQDNRLWSVRRKNVVPAFAIGLFIAFMPIPGHTILGILFAIILRINVPIAAIATWISNPLTIGPMYYFGYRLGLTLFDLPMQEFDFELSWSWITHTFTNIWQPLLLGCLILGIITASLGYLLLEILWKISISNYKIRKKNYRSK